MSTAKASSAAQRRLRFELVFASICIAFGLFVLPALIYVVGILLLGPYGDGEGLGRFYADYFRDLAEPSARVWTLVLGPWVLLSLLRLLLVRRRPAPPVDEEPAASPPPASAPRTQERRRVEPRVSL
jgi:hypothetical protein